MREASAALLFGGRASATSVPDQGFALVQHVNVDGAGVESGYPACVELIWKYIDHLLVLFENISEGCNNRA